MSTVPLLAAALVVSSFGFAAPAQGSATVTAKSCKNQSGTRTEFIKIKNRLDVPVKVVSDQIDCYDWSGVSNPSRYNGNYPAHRGMGKSPLELNKGYFRRNWRTTVSKESGKVVGDVRLFLNWFPCGQGYEQMRLGTGPGQDFVVPMGTVGGRKTQMRLKTVDKKRCVTDYVAIVVEYA